jgi:TRAP-type C4-dicarboxylate transport system substrate-binding protein
VFDTVGVTGFEALQTPMLIDTPELAGAVATGDVAADMLAGLDDQGIVGLGLVYEGLRRPLALNGAVTRATDLEGLSVRVPVSGVSDQVFTALGAVPDNGASHIVSTSGERYPVVETELALADTDFPAGGTVTANLVFFPKYDAILANPDSLGRLDEDQQDAIRQAAAEAVAGAVQTTADEEALAATYCETAGDLVSASLGEVRAIRARLRPVVDELGQDPATAAAIDEIRRLEIATTAPRFRAPPSCSPRTGDGALLPSAPAAPTP